MATAHLIVVVFCCPLLGAGRLMLSIEKVSKNWDMPVYEVVDLRELLQFSLPLFPRLPSIFFLSVCPLSPPPFLLSFLPCAPVCVLIFFTSTILFVCCERMHGERKRERRNQSIHANGSLTCHLLQFVILSLVEPDLTCGGKSGARFSSFQPDYKSVSK